MITNLKRSKSDGSIIYKLNDISPVKEKTKSSKKEKLYSNENGSFMKRKSFKLLGKTLNRIRLRSNVDNYRKHQDRIKKMSINSMPLTYGHRVGLKTKNNNLSKLRSRKTIRKYSCIHDGKFTSPRKVSDFNNRCYGSIKSYKTIRKLGEGAYAQVYQAHSYIHNVSVALKIIKLNKNEGAPATAIREISILRKLVHVNIIKLHDIVERKNNLCLVFEYIPYDLKYVLKNLLENLTNKEIKLIMLQLFRGIEFCHRNQIIHRDLKPQNILILSNGNLKIADFGLSRMLSVNTQEHLSLRVVTLWYRPPEVLLGCREYDYSVDIWSIGCIMAQLFSRNVLMPGKDKKTQLFKIIEMFGAINENNMPELKTYKQLYLIKDFADINCRRIKKETANYKPDFKELFFNCMDYNRKNRITAQEALNSKYFAKYNDRINHLDNETCILTLMRKNLKLDYKIMHQD